MALWNCSCRRCSWVGDDVTRSAARYYANKWGRGSNDIHRHERIMSYDLEHTEDPLSKRIIAWRLGDPRVIRDKPYSVRGGNHV